MTNILGDDEGGKYLSAVACGAMAAVMVPTLIVGLIESWKGDLKAVTIVVLFAALIAFLHVLLIGLPVWFLLFRLKLIRWWSSAVVGFAAGAVPMALYSWPYSKNRFSYSAWDGAKTVQYIVDGLPTAAGWTSYLNGCAATSLLGASAAISFWFVWRQVRGPTLVFNKQSSLVV